MIKSKLPKKIKIVMIGNNHKLFIDERVTFKKGVIWFEDKDCMIRIGKGSTIEEADLAVAENGTKLVIGEDCMFSRCIHIATTDSHSIISDETGKRVNPAKDIIIGNHVWLGYCTNINKGVVVGDNAVVAGHSVVTKNVPSNCVAAGLPAKVVKEHINWNRIRI